MAVQLSSVSEPVVPTKLPTTVSPKFTVALLNVAEPAPRPLIVAVMSSGVWMVLVDVNCPPVTERKALLLTPLGTSCPTKRLLPQVTTEFTSVHEAGANSPTIKPVRRERTFIGHVERANIGRGSCAHRGGGGVGGVMGAVGDVYQTVKYHRADVRQSPKVHRKAGASTSKARHPAEWRGSVVTCRRGMTPALVRKEEVDIRADRRTCRQIGHTVNVLRWKAPVVVASIVAMGFRSRIGDVNGIRQIGQPERPQLEDVSHLPDAPTLNPNCQFPEIARRRPSQ